MEVLGQALVALLLVALGGSAYLIVAAARVRPEEPAARFRSGWLGAFGLMLGLSSGSGLAAILAEVGTGSVAGFVAAVALNVVLQPIALLVCWAGVRKIAVGLCGGVAYAWRRLPESELADVPPAERRQLSWFCVLQGIVVLPVGAAISAALASPLVLWLIAEPAAAADGGGR